MTKEKIEETCEPFDKLAHLECDGMSNVLQSKLAQEGIRAELYCGRLSYKERSLYHQWLRVGEYFIDYRARMWTDETAQHGVFKEGDIVFPYSEAKRLWYAPLSKSVVEMLLAPISVSD